MIFAGHLGLGDHLILCGMVYYYAKQYDKIEVICKPHNYYSILFMYKNSNISVTCKNDDNEVFEYIKDKQYIGNGIFGFNWNWKPSQSFDESFYEQANIPFDIKYQVPNFRNYEIEENLYDKIVDQKDYIFVHDQASNLNVNLNLNYSNIIKPVLGLTNNIFDYLTIIERAKEIHCIDSSFLSLIDIFSKRKDNLFYHTVPNRTNPPKLKTDWKYL